ncbi:MAG: hypothetical protein ACI8PG_003234, partial [Planctomycetota bacterium]
MRQLLFWFLVSLLALPVGAFARQLYQLGGVSGTAWLEAGTPSFIDAEKVPGGIRPLSTDLSQNLIVSMGDRGGDITSLVSIYTLPAN